MSALPAKRNEPKVTRPAVSREYLECLEPDGRKVMYRTETVLASPELQKQCTEKRVLKRILASMLAVEEKGTLEKRPSTMFGLLFKFVLPGLAVFGIGAMMAGRKSDRE